MLGIYILNNIYLNPSSLEMLIQLSLLEIVGMGFLSILMLSVPKIIQSTRLESNDFFPLLTILTLQYILSYL